MIRSLSRDALNLRSFKNLIVMSRFQMRLSSRRKDACIKIIRDLMKKKISLLFAEPVDPKLDKCENYFAVIKNPMDLGTVLSKLESDQYETFSAFKADVELVWSNALTYNPPDSPITFMSLQLRDWFRESTFLMTDDEAADWVTKLTDIQYQIAYYSRMYEEGKAAPRLPAKPIAWTGGKQFPTKKRPPGLSNAQNEVQGEDSHQRKEIKKRRAPKKKQEKKMSYSDTEELTSQINGLEDEEVILKVLGIIQQEEPELNISEDSEVNMLTLSNSTRFKVLAYLQKFE